MWQRLSYAWRPLRRAPLFSITVVLTLTMGLGSASAIFAVVNAVLLRPLPYGHPDRLVGAWHDMPSISLMHAQQTAGTYRTYKRFATTIDGIALYNETAANVSDPDGRAEPERMTEARVTADSFRCSRSRRFSDARSAKPRTRRKDRASALISEGLWRSRYGGDRNVIGKKLLVFGKIDGDHRRDAGELPLSERRTRNSGSRTQLDPNDPYPGGFSHNGIARLKPGVTVEAAQRDFANVLPRMVDSLAECSRRASRRSMLLDQAKPVPRLIPMRDDVVGDIASTLWMVAATAGLVLLVTCANVANLLLVRADGRHRELSVRAALGAGRSRIMRSFLHRIGCCSLRVSSILGLGVACMAIAHAGRAGAGRRFRVSPKYTSTGR